MPSSHLFQQAIRRAALPTTGAAVATVTSSCTTYLAERNAANATSHLSKKAMSTAMTSFNSKYASSLVSSTVKRQQCTTLQTTTKRFLTNNKMKSSNKTAFSSSVAAPPPQAAAANVAAKEATPPVTNKGRKGFVEWYESYLQSSPVKTKMVTGGILWGLGDLVAQVVPPVFFPPEEGEEGAKKSSSSFVYDYPRTARAVIFGFGIHAPCAHVHYNFLEWMTVRAGIEGLKIPLFKAFMEQFVYWSWFSNSLYHGAIGAMQGMTPNEIYDRIADVLWDTQKAQWVFWIPVQLLNFRFVPVRHQLNVVLVTSIVWTALLSAWYPPQNDEEESDGREESRVKQIEEGKTQS